MARAPKPKRETTQAKRTVGRPFQKGNPGRPKGSRNKLSEDVIRDVCAVWEESGIEALRVLAVNDPGKFVDAAIKLVPKDVNHNIRQTAAELTDDELVAIIRRGSSEGTAEAEEHSGITH